MKARLPLTPAQLVLVSLFGFVISAASLFLSRYTRTADACDCIRWTPFLLIFGSAIAGIVISLYASSSLKNGIENQQWPVKQIEPLRSWLESPFTNALVVALLVAYTIFWFSHSRYRALGFASFVLMQVITQLRTAIRRPRPQSSNTLPSWRDLSPLHSDQWGRR